MPKAVYFLGSKNHDSITDMTNKVKSILSKYSKSISASEAAASAKTFLAVGSLTSIAGPSVPFSQVLAAVPVPEDPMLKAWKQLLHTEHMLKTADHKVSKEAFDALHSLGESLVRDNQITTDKSTLSESGIEMLLLGELLNIVGSELIGAVKAKEPEAEKRAAALAKLEEIKKENRVKCPVKEAHNKVRNDSEEAKSDSEAKPPAKQAESFAHRVQIFTDQFGKTDGMSPDQKLRILARIYAALKKYEATSSEATSSKDAFQTVYDAYAKELKEEDKKNGQQVADHHALYLSRLMLSSSSFFERNLEKQKIIRHLGRCCRDLYLAGLIQGTVVEDGLYAANVSILLDDALLYLDDAADLMSILTSVAPLLDETARGKMLLKCVDESIPLYVAKGESAAFYVNTLQRLRSFIASNIPAETMPDQEPMDKEATLRGQEHPIAKPRTSSPTARGLAHNAVGANRAQPSVVKNGKIADNFAAVAKQLTERLASTNENLAASTKPTRTISEPVTSGSKSHQPEAGKQANKPPVMNRAVSMENSVARKSVVNDASPTPVPRSNNLPKETVVDHPVPKKRPENTKRQSYAGQGDLGQAVVKASTSPTPAPRPNNLPKETVVDQPVPKKRPENTKRQSYAGQGDLGQAVVKASTSPAPVPRSDNSEKGKEPSLATAGPDVAVKTVGQQPVAKQKPVRPKSYAGQGVLGQAVVNGDSKAPAATSGSTPPPPPPASSKPSAAASSGSTPPPPPPASSKPSAAASSGSTPPPPPPASSKPSAAAKSAKDEGQANNCFSFFPQIQANKESAGSPPKLPKSPPTRPVTNLFKNEPGKLATLDEATRNSIAASLAKQIQLRK